MKKLLVSTSLFFLVVAATAQSEKYTKAMQANVATIDSLHTGQAWTDMANTFQRIADAEKPVAALLLCSTWLCNDRLYGRRCNRWHRRRR